MTLRMMQHNKAAQLLRGESSDDEYMPNQRSSMKRKRQAAEMDSHSATMPSPAAASAAAASFHSTPLTFPCLSDNELRVPSSFLPVGKFLFALEDETRDRGSAKLAIIHVQLSHPAFATQAAAASSSSSRYSPASQSRNYTASFKIDGRKSFSNAPFKKYYHRAVHAAWFATPTKDVQATNPPLNASFPSGTDGRVLFVLSQRNGKPQGKAFTGMLHDTSSYCSKHPLLCLSSNSVEYYLHVYLNCNAQVDGECETVLDSWNEVDVDVSARFDAGSVKLDSLSLRAASHIVQPQPKQARTTLPNVSSMPHLDRCSSSDSSASSAFSASSTASAASPVSSSSASDDSDVSDSPYLESPMPPSSDEDCEYTPLHEPQEAESFAESAELAGDVHFELPYAEFESECDGEPQPPVVVPMEEEPKRADAIIRLPNGVGMQSLDLLACEIYAAATAAPDTSLEVPPMLRGQSQPFMFSLKMPLSSPTWPPRNAPTGMPSPAPWAAMMVEQAAEMPMPSHMLAMSPISPLTTHEQIPAA